MIEVLKTKRFIPDKFTMDEDKRKNLPAPVMPAIEVAKIRAASEEKKMALEKDIAIAANALTKHRVDIDTDRDTAYNQALADREEAGMQLRLQELGIKRELAMLDYANKRDISLDKVKAELAQEAMRLKTQKELAGVAQVATPSFEPPGRAAPGHAFEQ